MFENCPMISFITSRLERQSAFLAFLVILLCSGGSKVLAQANYDGNVNKLQAYNSEMFSINNGLPNDNINQFAATVSSQLDAMLMNYNVAGAAVYVFEGDSSYEIYGGYAKWQIIPVTSETKFRVGSISKPVAAYGLLRLCKKLYEETGIDYMSKKNINDTFLANTGWKIKKGSLCQCSGVEAECENAVTLNQMILHTSGLNQSYFKDIQSYPGWDVITNSDGIKKLNGMPYNESNPYANLPDLDSVLCDSPSNSDNYALGGPVRLYWKPGAFSVYSGGNYAAIELIMNMILSSDAGYMNLSDQERFSSFMKNAVFDYFMPKSTFYYSKSWEDKRADGYYAVLWSNGSVVGGPYHTLFTTKSVAGLYTTANDLGSFAKVLMNDSIYRTIINPVIIEGCGDFCSVYKDNKICYVGEVIDVGNNDYAFCDGSHVAYNNDTQDKIKNGATIRRLNGFWAHTGFDKGSQCIMLFHPSLNAGLVVLTNTGTPAYYAGMNVCNAIADAWKAMYIGRPN